MILILSPIRIIPTRLRSINDTTLQHPEGVLSMVQERARKRTSPPTDPGGYPPMWDREYANGAERGKRPDDDGLQCWLREPPLGYGYPASHWPPEPKPSYSKYMHF